MSDKKNVKYIFVSGGVLSGLGKGVTAASLGFLLKNRGYKVTNLKCENYLNLDSGNINPVEHGDVFLCEDGTEADLDLGTYERFLGQEVTLKNYTTIGQIYSSVIEQAKNLEFNGKTVDAPYISEEIIRRIKTAAKGYDIILIELGGCAGEYLNSVYYEANRVMKLQYPKDVIHIHVSYFPHPPHINELKSKPTQLSVMNLNAMAIQPDFIVGRADVFIDDKRKEKVAYYCNIPKDHVISNPDLPSIYQLPLVFADQEFDKKVLIQLGLEVGRSNLTHWRDMVTDILNIENKPTVRVAIVAKYLASGDWELKDSYASLLEALDHAATAEHKKLELVLIGAEDLENKTQATLTKLKTVDGIIVPIGWGPRGVEGKIKAIQFARENKVPYLGLCYGMQLATIEFARHVCGLSEADTEENNPCAKDKIIHSIPFDSKYQRIKGENASMRLGGYDCVLKPNTLAYKIYDQSDAFKDKKHNLISERHRHRFEFNNHYRQLLEKNGMIFSGTSPDDFFVEMIELPSKMHPFFLATQAHPEYKSKPLAPHPIFSEFIRASFKNQHKK